MLKFNSPIIEIPKQMLLKTKKGQKVYNTLKKNGGLTSVKNKKSIQLNIIPDGNQIKIISPGEILKYNERKVLEAKMKKNLPKFKLRKRDMPFAI